MKFIKYSMWWFQKKYPHSLMCLSAWSFVVGGVGRCTLAGGCVSLWIGFKVSKAQFQALFSFPLQLSPSPHSTPCLCVYRS